MRRFLLTSLIWGALCACKTLPPLDGGSEAQRAQGRRVMVDAYLIAHGMARSYAGSAEANPARVAELRALDHQAALAVHAMLGRHDGSPDIAAAEVSALTQMAASARP